jgi:hypothetical protein
MMLYRRMPYDLRDGEFVSEAWANSYPATTAWKRLWFWQKRPAKRSAAGAFASAGGEEAQAAGPHHRGTWRGAELPGGSRAGRA